MNQPVAERQASTNDGLLDLRALLRLIEHLKQDRVLLKGGTHHCGMTFAKIGDTVIRVSSEVEKSPITFNWAANVVRCAPDRVSVNIAPATLGDLLDCQRQLERNGSGEARVRVAEFIAHVRQEAQPQPMQIEIVNASQIGKSDKIISIKRDSEGKLSGAAVQSVN